MRHTPYRKKHGSLFASTLPGHRKAPKNTLVDRIKVALGWLWRTIKRLCFVLGAMTLISAVFWGFLLSALVKTQPLESLKLADHTILTITLEGTLRDKQDEGFSAFNVFEPSPPALPDLVRTLSRAKDDPRIDAVFVELTFEPFVASFAQMQELRTAISDFRAAGKTAHIYAPSYNGIASIYLASAFDRRWSHALGVVDMAGFQLEIPFFRGTLDALGITPQVIQRKAYKTAYESATNTQISPENKEAMTALLNAYRTAVMEVTPGGLDLSDSAFEAVLDLGLFTARDAKNRGILTDLGSPDDAVMGLRSGLVEDKKWARGEIDYEAYLSVSDAHSHRKTRVALVPVQGVIMPTNPDYDPSVADGKRIAEGIETAAKDPDIAAILVRIDSPGGSPMGSEMILQAMIRAKMKGKPVVVSMGSVAASGGYWVASGADKIFALPTTVTGSIGVIAGKITAQDAWKKLNVNWDRSIAWGDNAGIWSPNAPFSKTQKARMDLMLDEIYDAFIQRVAEGRGLSGAQAEAVAQGRVWSGSDAKRQGLVDALGGIQVALSYLVETLDLDTPSDIILMDYPAPEDPFVRLMQMLEKQGGGLARLSAYASAVLGTLDAAGVSSLLPETKLLDDGTPLTYAPLTFK